jgi:TetR/AcrR family transcriptional regulator
MPESITQTEPPETERRIFEAALTVFARKGRDGARMQEIADLAGINRALLHYYFRTKQLLYAAVFTHLFQQYLESFQSVFDLGENFAETLRNFIDNYIDYIQAHQDMARLMVNENLAGGSMLGEHLARAFETKGSPQQRMEEAILGAIEAGEIHPVSARQTMLTIVSSCIFCFLMAPTVKATNPEAREDFDAFVAARKKHVFDIVYNGLRSRQES